MALSPEKFEEAAVQAKKLKIQSQLEQIEKDLDQAITYGKREIYVGELPLSETMIAIRRLYHEAGWGEVEFNPSHDNRSARPGSVQIKLVKRPT